jgi:hypothetical protein
MRIIASVLECYKAHVDNPTADLLTGDLCSSHNESISFWSSRLHLEFSRHAGARCEAEQPLQCIEGLHHIGRQTKAISTADCKNNE